MQIKNSKQKFGLVSILMHWLMGLLIIGMLGVGLYMVELPVEPFKFQLYGWHKATGFIVLLLALLRILWRICNITPALHLPKLEQFLARAMHWALYGFMFAMPMTGWLLTSAAGRPASFFGLFTIPNLIAPNEHTLKIFQDLHEWLAYGLIAAIVLHFAAALKHHFIDKDDILLRILK